jgi:ammonium transporter Rh
MIFIGFGFLMTFIKTNAWSALVFNWVLSVWCIQWAILASGFWHQILTGVENMHRIELSIESLIAGDFGAGAAMITFGVILGKVNM